MKDNNVNEINIIYKTENKEELNIFGYNFVRNNKDICHILIDNKKIHLCAKLRLNDNQKNNYMFHIYKSSLSLPDISKWDTKNVTNMTCMFSGCRSLSSLPDISKWDTKNVTNMKFMLAGCISLLSLPDISKWDTKNVTDMTYMFSCCKSKIIPQKFKNL